jgi:hypothetical protein
VLVKTTSGEIVFSLDAQDFLITDNGIPQSVQMEKATEAQPHSIVIVVETGGNGTLRLKDYSELGAVLDALVGNGAHQVAVVSSTSHLISYKVLHRTPTTQRPQFLSCSQAMRRLQFSMRSSTPSICSATSQRGTDAQ